MSVCRVSIQTWHLLIFADFTLRNCGTWISDYIRCWAQWQWTDGLTWKVRMYLAPWFIREYHHVPIGFQIRTIQNHNLCMRVEQSNGWQLGCKAFFSWNWMLLSHLESRQGVEISTISASWVCLKGWFIIFPVPQRENWNKGDFPPTFAQVWALAWWWLDSLCEELRQLETSVCHLDSHFGVRTSKKKWVSW